MKPTIHDIIFMAGFFLLVAGCNMQLGTGPALIVAGVILIVVAVYPFIKRRNNVP